MPRGGSRAFVDPDDYEANISYVEVDLVLTSPGTFKARLTWADLHQVHLLRSDEEYRQERCDAKRGSDRRCFGTRCQDPHVFPLIDSDLFGREPCFEAGIHPARWRSSNRRS